MVSIYVLKYSYKILKHLARCMCVCVCVCIPIQENNLRKISPAVLIQIFYNLYCFTTNLLMMSCWHIFSLQLQLILPSCKINKPMSNNHSSVGLYLNQFSHSVVSDSLQPRELQHTRPPCPSPTPGVYPNSHPLSQ